MTCDRRCVEDAASRHCCGLRRSPPVWVDRQQRAAAGAAWRQCRCVQRARPPATWRRRARWPASSAAVRMNALLSARRTGVVHQRQHRARHALGRDGRQYRPQPRARHAARWSASCCSWPRPAHSPARSATGTISCSARAAERPDRDRPAVSSAWSMVINRVHGAARQSGWWCIVPADSQTRPVSLNQLASRRDGELR